MKKHIASLFSALTVLLAVSCKNEIPFDINENPPKLVMNAFINADSLTNYLFLNLTGRRQPTHVEDASLEVRVNGMLREKLRPMAVEATADGLHHAWAEVTVPQRMTQALQVETANASLRRHGAVQEFLCYKITLNDIPNEKNFYRLIVDKQTKWFSRFEERNLLHPENETLQGNKKILTETYHDYQYIFREDVVLTDGHPQSDAEEENGMFDNASNVYGVFDDSRFESSPYTLTVYNNPSPQRYGGIQNILRYTVDVYIRLLSITEAEYYYLKALNIIDSDVFDEVLNEPISYPSNVHGGTGIVGISTEISKVIHLEDKDYEMKKQ